MEAANTIQAESANLPASHLATTVIFGSIVTALCERGAIDLARLIEIVEEQSKKMDGPADKVNTYAHLAYLEVCKFKQMLVEMAKPAPEPGRIN